MKKNIPIYALACVLFIITNCSKDNRLIPIATAVECDKSLHTFSQKIEGYFAWCDLIEDAAKNIVIAGNNNVQKYSAEGNLLWKTDINFPGQMQSIIQADGDNYFISSCTNEIESYSNYDLYTPGISGPLTLSSYYDTHGNSRPDCETVYNRITFNNGETRSFLFKPAPPGNKSTCTLSKISFDGRLLWQKTVQGNYFEGNSLCKTTDGNIYLLTFFKRGFYKSAIFDSNGIFQDTLTPPYILDNYFLLSKISPEGAIVWQKKIDQVHNALPDYDKKINLAATSGAVFIQNSNELITLSHSGNILKREGSGLNCTYSTYGCVSKDDKLFVTGYGRSNSYSGYYAIYSGNGQITASNYSVAPLPRNARLHETGDGFIFHMSDYVVKFNDRFSVLWGLNYYNVARIHAAKGTCSGGIIMIKSANNEYELVKLDANGQL